MLRCHQDSHNLRHGSRIDSLLIILLGENAFRVQINQQRIFAEKIVPGCKLILHIKRIFRKLRFMNFMAARFF